MSVLHSIVIPVFNESSGIEELFSRMRRVVDSIEESCEVILVNDGSSDNSAELLDNVHERDPRFKVIHFSRNFGHQAAITAGLQYATGNTVTVIDADLQDPPELITSFIAKWRDGFEVVYGVRRSRAGETKLKLWTAKLFYRLVRSITQLDMPVDAGDFRLIDRKVVRAFLSLPERNRYVRGLVSWIGFKQAGIEYDRAQRFSGETHYPFKKMLKLAFDGISSFSFLPLRIATWMGFLSSLAAVGVGAWAIYLHFMTIQTIPGWTSLILVMLFLGGAQLVALGILGEYIGRMFDEVRQRPIYLVSRVTGVTSQNSEDAEGVVRAA
jgi:polyisoprenyl-phosphate glycosyltransferase